jgi:hypothetical protein
MLNQTKTWLEEFRNKFPDKIARVIDDFEMMCVSDCEPQEYCRLIIRTLLSVV